MAVPGALIQESALFNSEDDSRGLFLEKKILVMTAEYVLVVAHLDELRIGKPSGNVPSDIAFQGFFFIIHPGEARFEQSCFRFPRNTPSPPSLNRYS